MAKTSVPAAGIGHNGGPYTGQGLKPLAHTILETMAIVALGRNSVYGLIESGALDSFALCGRRLITRLSIEKVVAEARRGAPSEFKIKDRPTAWAARRGEPITNKKVGVTPRGRSPRQSAAE